MLLCCTDGCAGWLNGWLRLRSIHEKLPELGMGFIAGDIPVVGAPLQTSPEESYLPNESLPVAAAPKPNDSAAAARWLSMPPDPSE